MSDNVILMKLNFLIFYYRFNNTPNLKSENALYVSGCKMTTKKFIGINMALILMKAQMGYGKLLKKDLPTMAVDPV